MSVTLVKQASVWYHGINTVHVRLRTTLVAYDARIRTHADREFYFISHELLRQTNEFQYVESFDSFTSHEAVPNTLVNFQHEQHHEQTRQ